MTANGRAEVRDLLKRGELLAAYDRASELLDRDPTDPVLRYLAALALARAGAVRPAGAELSKLDADRMAELDSPRLAGDVAALQARLVKDQALGHSGATRREHASEASRLYESVFRTHGGYFAGINAATMAAVAGDRHRSIVLAAEALELAAAEGATDDEDRYWRAATRAEASLLLGDLAGAAQALEQAVPPSEGNTAWRATTRRQLQLICREAELDPGLLDALPVPAVVHYTGHRFTEADVDLAALRSQVDAALDAGGVGVAFGSLAYGADILVAEQVLARGNQLHVVLPCPADQFAGWSVAPGGEDWMRRFEECLAGATSVWCDPSYAPAEDAVMYGYGSQLAMGHAVMHAQAITGTAFQLALWDGEGGEAAAGTASDVGRWKETGGKTVVIPCGHPDSPTTSSRAESGPSMELRAMMFADFRAFSALDERQVLTFFESVMGALAEVIDDFGDEVVFRNSWGDGLYLVFRTTRSATTGSLSLQQGFAALDLEALDLPPEMGLRIGVHTGPVYAAVDPIRREPSFFGTHVTRTARIEPRTPAGEVYMTASSAALLALDPVPGMIPEYVGHIATAKDFGVFPMYVLTRR